MVFANKSQKSLSTSFKTRCFDQYDQKSSINDLIDIDYQIVFETKLWWMVLLKQAKTNQYIPEIVCLKKSDHIWICKGIK